MTALRLLILSLTLGLLPLPGSPAQPMPAELAAGVYRLRVTGLTVEVHGADAGDWRDLETLLTDRLTLSSDTAPSPPLADDLAFFTRQFLVHAGFPKASVDWRLQPPGIVLTIDSGVQVVIGEIEWTGETILEPSELEEYLLRPTKERSTKLKPDGLYVQADIDQGVSLVGRRLRAEGYLEATVTATPAPTLTSTDQRALTVHVVPGPAFEFGTLQHGGAPQETQEQVAKILSDVPGGPFNEARVQALEAEMKSACVSQGFLNTKVTSVYDLGTQGGTVDVEFEIVPGARARIVAIDPHPGFTDGADRVLRAHFKEASGQFYSSEELDFMYRRAISTNIFSRLDYEARPVAPIDPDSAVVDAQLRLTGEQVPPHTLGFQIGFDTFLGPQAGIRYRNSNFLDTGNTLAAEASWSQGGPLGSLEFSDPAVFGTPYAATARGAAEQFSLYDYTRNSGSLTLQLSRRVTEPFSFTVFVGASGNAVSTDVLTPDELGPADYTLASIGTSMLYDRRDSIVLPTKGWFLSARTEQFFNLQGESFSYQQADLESAFFHPLTKKLRFATGITLQSIIGASASELPIDNRVFNGGPNSVRSFYQRELGPSSAAGDTPLGGTASFVGSAELSYEFMPNLEFALFTDVGSLSQQDHGSAFEFSTDFRYAVGAGLRYRLPFGPIRLDYGYNPAKREGEDQGVLHITVGFSF